MEKRGGVMSDHFNEIEHLRHTKDGFDIRVGYYYEDIHPKDLYCDETDTDHMAKRIDEGYDAWFVFGARVYLRGHLMGSSSLGGLYYKDDHAESVIEKQAEHNDDCWYGDCIDEAIAEAKKESTELHKQLELKVSCAEV
jgi:hypothetical protein